MHVPKTLSTLDFIEFIALFGQCILKVFFYYNKKIEYDYLTKIYGPNTQECQWLDYFNCQTFLILDTNLSDYLPSDKKSDYSVSKFKIVRQFTLRHFQTFGPIIFLRYPRSLIENRSVKFSGKFATNFNDFRCIETLFLHIKKRLNN